MGDNAQYTAGRLPLQSVVSNVWRIFVSYRRSELTNEIAFWLKRELEREVIESSTGETFVLDVFVDAAEPHRSDWEASLVPRLRHSRALIVLADEGAAVRREGTDYLFRELDWWASERRAAPPILLQLEAQSGAMLVADAAFTHWRKVNILDCFWARWGSEPDSGAAARQRLLAQVRESIRVYGQIVQIEEVRRLRRRSVAATVCAVAALIAAGVTWQQRQEAQRQREVAVKQEAIAQTESNAAALAAAQIASANGVHATARNWLERIPPERRGWEWFYLRGMADTSRVTLRQVDEFLGSRITWERYDDRQFKEAEIARVSFSPDGRYVAAGTDRGDLLLWEARSGMRIRTARMSRGIRCQSFDPAAENIAVGSADGSILIYNLEAKTTTKLPDQEGMISGLMYATADRLISAAWDGGIKVWNARTLSMVASFECPGAAQQRKDLAESTARQFKQFGFAAFNELMGGVQVLKLSKKPSVIDGHLHLQPIPASVLSAALAGDGRTVWAELGDNSIVQVDPMAGRLEVISNGSSHSDLFPGLRPFVVDRQVIREGGNLFNGPALAVWEPERPKQKLDVRGLGGDIVPIAMSPQGDYLVARSVNDLRVYRTRDLSLSKNLIGHDLEVNDVAFAPDGTIIASGSADGHVKLWEIGARRTIESVKAHSKAVTSLMFRTFGGEVSLISASEDGSVLAHPLRSGQAPEVLFQEKHAVRSISISNDGTKLAVAAEGTNAAVVDLVGQGRPTYSLRGTEAKAIAFNRDGTQLILGLGRNEGLKSLRIVYAFGGWNAAEVSPYEGVDEIERIILEPAGERFVWSADSGTGVGSAGISDASSGTLIKSIGCSDGCSDVAINSVGSTTATGTSKGEIEVSTIGVPKMRGHLGRITGLTFTSRGTRLISGSEDASIRVWDAVHGRELLVIQAGGPVRSIAMSPDGKIVAAGLADGTIRFWVAPDAPPN